MDRVVKKVLVDTETGEEIILYEGDRITRKQSMDYLSDTTKMDIETFFKGSIEELRLLLPELSTTEKAFLLSIAPYVGYTDCCLKYGNNKDIGTEGMINITGLSRRCVYDTINKLISKDIIYRGKNSNNRQYFANPWLFSKGNRVNKVLRTMFKNYKIRSKGNVKWGKL